MCAGKNNAALTATAATRLDTLVQTCQRHAGNAGSVRQEVELALGTLGGGNHRIELAEDLDGAVW